MANVPPCLVALLGNPDLANHFSIYCKKTLDSRRKWDHIQTITLPFLVRRIKCPSITQTTSDTLCMICWVLPIHAVIKSSAATSALSSVWVFSCFTFSAAYQVQTLFFDNSTDNCSFWTFIFNIHEASYMCGSPCTSGSPGREDLEADGIWFSSTSCCPS